MGSRRQIGLGLMLGEVANADERADACLIDVDD
jgi:hypothetical protein